MDESTRVSFRNTIASRFIIHYVDLTELLLLYRTNVDLLAEAEVDTAAVAEVTVVEETVVTVSVMVEQQPSLNKPQIRPKQLTTPSTQQQLKRLNRPKRR